MHPKLIRMMPCGTMTSPLAARLACSAHHMALRLPHPTSTRTLMDIRTSLPWCSILMESQTKTECMQPSALGICVHSFRLQSYPVYPVRTTKLKCVCDAGMILSPQEKLPGLGILARSRLVESQLTWLVTWQAGRDGLQWVHMAVTEYF